MTDNDHSDRYRRGLFSSTSAKLRTPTNAAIEGVKRQRGIEICSSARGYQTADLSVHVQSLQDLLHRITWDPEFGKGRFALGYEDRMVPQETVVPFADVRFDRERPGTFLLQQEDGSVMHIPLHRVRTVYKNGEAIWRRPARAPRG